MRILGSEWLHHDREFGLVSAAVFLFSGEFVVDVIGTLNGKIKLARWQSGKGWQRIHWI